MGGALIKSLFARRFPLLVLALLIALASSGIAYALSTQELPPTWLSTFNRSFGLWVVTTESEFNDGVLNNVDTSSSPGDVKLAIPDDWYDASWSRRAPVTISNNSGSALTYYQVEVDVTYDADMQPDFDDIRFTASDGTTLLSYWRESYSASTSAVFWVKVSSVPAGDSTIYMYYGNAGVSSTSNGTNTFDFFDNFPGASVDTGKWDIMYSSYVAVSGGTLKLSGSGTEDTNGGIWTTEDFGTSYVVTMRAFLVDAFPSFVWFVQSDDEGYCEAIHDVDGLGVFFRFTFGEPSSSVFLNIGTNNYVRETWSIIDIKASGSDYDLYQGGNFKSSYSDSDLSGGGIGLEQWDGGPSEYDWILVRKYADPEPTTVVGAEEGLYSSPGTIASSVYDTSKVNAGWDLLGWDKTLPSGTDITFEVRASDTIFLKGDATPAWQDASVLPTGRYQQWRATLTSNSLETPILHEVWDLYSW